MRLFCNASKVSDDIPSPGKDIPSSGKDIPINNKHKAKEELKKPEEHKKSHTKEAKKDTHKEAHKEPQSEAMKAALKEALKDPESHRPVTMEELKEENIKLHMKLDDFTDLAKTNEELLKETVELKQQVGDLKDKYLRSLAELENVRERAHREVVQIRKFGIQDFAKSMLSVADNIQRALKTIDEAGYKPLMENNTDEGRALKVLYEGIMLTNLDMLQTLGKYDIKKMEALGEKFDPKIHNALFEVDDSSKDPFTVAVVHKEGYLIGDRVLRAAEVGTVKAP